LHQAACSQIALYEDIILKNILPDNKNIEIRVSILGVGFTIGSSILAEIGKYQPIQQSEITGKLGGLSPAVFESAGKTAHGQITKRGSKYLGTNAY
jgi:transposase